MPINYPKVDRAAVDGFLKVYNQGGLHLLFDSTSRQAMVDFANIALKSYVDNLQERAKAALAAQQKLAGQQANAPQAPAPVAPPQKSSIILTD